MLLVSDSNTVKVSDCGCVDVVVNDCTCTTSVVCNRCIVLRVVKAVKLSSTTNRAKANISTARQAHR
jgi:hypothetical protein